MQITPPIIAGNIRACIDLSSVSDTDWHDLSSSDFLDTTTGSACAAGLAFLWVGVLNLGTNTMHIKYRARTTAGDATTNEIAVSSEWRDDLGTLRTSITTIAYRKSGASDEVHVFAGFAGV